MYYPRTLTAYILKLILRYLFIVTGVVVVVLIISNLFNFFHYVTKYQPPLIVFVNFILLKIPYLISETSVLIAFIATILLLNRMINYNELTAIIASGISLQCVFTIISVLFLIISIFIQLILNPIAAYSFDLSNKFERRLIKKSSDYIVFSDSGIFFSETIGNTRYIIQTNHIDLKDSILNDVILINTDTENNFIQRIDSKYAKLIDGKLQFINPIIQIGGDISKPDILEIKTNLSIKHIKQSFKSPNALNILQLSKIINTFSKLGIPTINYKLTFYKHIFNPLIITSFVMFACCFTRVRNRKNFYFSKLILPVVLGVSVYVLFELTLRVLVYSNINIVVSMFLLLLLIVLISTFVIMHYEY